ncbi:ATPase, T2SS/T4P/T4SS family [Companilactobacillus alimentarius]|nr:ATPase, T2SS/T4P/T4SS family [Companilactobacillus alimentarius]MDT6952047.1 ATPase, T2SS/T4P/T4SS family [Companilactobacillus alimentarius]
MVVRLIYPQEYNTPIDEGILEKLRPVSQKKGMMLFAGPMGSGKTSLMYSLSRRLSATKKVMCIEDPIEIVEDDFLQLQVNDDAGMTYEELIKTSLRHRPEVLIIGEIRDKNTAKQAIQAALCGYTVMSTIHGKSKYSVLQRLRQFGIEDVEIINAVNFISYQRLVPVFDNLELFLDSMEISEIKKYLADGLPDEQWQQLLKNAYQAGQINEETYQEYLS